MRHASHAEHAATLGKSTPVYLTCPTPYSAILNRCATRDLPTCMVLHVCMALTDGYADDSADDDMMMTMTASGQCSTVDAPTDP